MPFSRCLSRLPSLPFARDQMSRHTARTTTTTATRAAALSRRPSPIVLQSKKATPRSSSRALLSTRRSVDTVSREAGGRGGEGGAAPRDAFRSSTKEERQRQQRPAGALEVRRACYTINRGIYSCGSSTVPVALNSAGCPLCGYQVLYIPYPLARPYRLII